MPTGPDKKVMRRAVAASVIGATLEWYDFFLYGVVAGLVLNKQYFPLSDPLVSTLLAYSSWAVGFVTRPLGGLIFGHFGDKFGRKKMMVLTLMIMGASTVLIGCIPTYEQIGIFAPLTLVLLRVLQGIGLGGEWGGAVLMTYEYATENRRGFFASLTQVGLSLGMFAASGAVGITTAICSQEGFMSYGWRIPFLISSVLLIIGWYIRVNVMETPDFQKVKQENEVPKQEAPPKIPLMELLRNYKAVSLAGLLARGVGGVGFNIFAVYVIVYLTDILKMARSEALFAVNVGTIAFTIVIPLAGWLGDKYGRIKVFIVGCLLEGACAFPVFWLIVSRPDNIWLVCLAIVASLGICHGIVSGLIPSVFSDLFPCRMRYTGISFVFQISSLFFSGLTPIIALFLVRYNNNDPWLLSGYVLLTGIVSAAASVWIRNRDRQLAMQEVCQEVVMPG